MDPSHGRVQLAARPWTSWLSGWFQALGPAACRPLLAALLLVGLLALGPPGPSCRLAMP